MSDHEVRRYVVLHDGEVIATVLWDGHTPYDPGEGTLVVPADEYQPPAGDAAPAVPKRARRS